MAWSRLRQRFLKGECRQSYHEPERNRSQEVYHRGDSDRAVNLLREEAESDRPLFDDIRHRGIEYARIRLVHVRGYRLCHYVTFVGVGSCRAISHRLAQIAGR
ncbi:hypothetical protein [Microbispora sp. NBC_01389]|uniref:hypothetical protein n=1 Tax=Microbispora sp. NBC_01389 TaxID=2903584 RepID=UPI00386865B8